MVSVAELAAILLTYEIAEVGNGDLPVCIAVCDSKSRASGLVVDVSCVDEAVTDSGKHVLILSSDLLHVGTELKHVWEDEADAD